MADSNSFSSLFALIDSHLSKTDLQHSSILETGSSSQHMMMVTEPSSGGPMSTQSESFLSSSRGMKLPIPPLGNSNSSSISNILAEQVANMLKAKEEKLKKEAELKNQLIEDFKRQRISDDDNEDEERNNYVIDLMQAVNVPYNPGPIRETKPEALSQASSLESLNNLQEPAKPVTPEPLLPCIQDMSYMLKMKRPKVRCSDFGKVLVARYRPVAAPYIKEKIQHNIIVFDFNTKSPCDLYKENLRKPSSYNAYAFDVVANILGRPME